MLFIDTETVGLTGPIVLIQYAEDNESVILHDVFINPIRNTLNLIGYLTNYQDGLVFFNAAFDWFHLYKLWCLFSSVDNKSKLPIDIINELKNKESKARDIEFCLKPHKVIDLMLHARKGKYQSLMDRHDIRIKKVPTQLAWILADELEKLPIKDIYFAKRKTERTKWSIEDIKDPITGAINRDFKNLVLKFASSTALKALAVDALGIKEQNILLLGNISNELKAYYPEELGYAPYWPHCTWPNVVDKHVSYWLYNQTARKYATDDVEYTRGLFKYFGLSHSDFNDDDSILACCVAVCRWRGYTINFDKINELKIQCLEKIKNVPTAPAAAKYYIGSVMSDEEKIVFSSTSKNILEDLGNRNDIVGSRSREVLEARQATKQIELYNKFLLADRFHASFKVIGTLSSRMAGSDGLNPQGINHSTEVRSCFPLAQINQEYTLDVGDFESFEVSLADAVYDDPTLRNDLQSGKKIHALFAKELFQDYSYEEIMNSKGTKDDLYDKGKRAIFALIYGGNEHTLKKKIGIPLEIGSKAFESFFNRYKKVKSEREKVLSKFQSMKQPRGIGSKVEWHEPTEYIESLFGFKRYFTLENMICKSLYNLANKPTKELINIGKSIRVVRNREQTGSGATQSALFGAAFAIQSSAMRAAANHVIQSSGATITKKLQRKIWDIQPNGISKWIVQPMNIHDEILVPNYNKSEQIRSIVNETVEELKPIVPLLSIDWKSNISSWGDK